MCLKLKASPLMRQCFVTIGVALNISGSAVVMAFTAGMLSQLKSSLEIPVGTSIGSWIAASPSICLLLSNFFTPSLMNAIGRRYTNIISISILIIGWLAIALAQNVTVILLGRFLQGVSIGMALNFGPTLIGEYASPKYRGAFLMSVSLLTAIVVLITHTIGVYFSWRSNAFICLVIAFINLLIAIWSPESPIWLADKRRYDKCRTIFIWLRGIDENDELENIIKDSMMNDNKSKFMEIKETVKYFKHNINKREFYLPIVIMIHVYAISQWGGINILATYVIDVFENVIGKSEVIPLHIVALDTQRIVSNFIAIFLIQRVKRRTILASLTSLGILTMILIALYTYVKSKHILPFDHPSIGVILIHLHMFSIATCTISVPYIIAGEIFPLKHKGIAGGISIFFYAIHFSVVVKTAPYLISVLGIHGTYLIYASVVAYSLVVTMIFLPETKDRTLQDIEREFRGHDLEESETNQHLRRKLVSN